MRWGSAASTAPTLAAAVDEAAGSVRAALDGVRARPRGRVRLAAPRGDLRRAARRWYARALGGGLLIGCSAGGVIGGGREIEEQPGLSLTAAALPGVTSPRSTWRRRRGRATRPDARRRSFILLPDPFTFDVETLLARCSTRPCPDATVIGGLASGGREPGANALYLGDAVHRARPGRRRAQRQRRRRHHRRAGLPADRRADVRHPLRAQRHPRARRPAPRARCCRSSTSARPPTTAALFRHSLFLGVVMREDRQEYGQGDFLIRNVLGIDGKTGALVVGALVARRHGRAVPPARRRHVRRTISSPADALSRRNPPASLLFSCLGRGKHLYGAPGPRHRRLPPACSATCRSAASSATARSVRCRASTFLHGYTSAFGLFRPRR